MIEVPIDADMIARSRRRADKLGVLNRSFMHGRGNFVGFLVEEIVLAAFPGAELADDYNFDIIYAGMRFDVKTKRTSAVPLPHYLCSVSDHNTRQKTDNYLFCRVLEVNGEFRKGWILGYLPKEEFYNKAFFMRKGEREGDNGYVVKSDCWSVRIDSLRALVGEETG